MTETLEPTSDRRESEQRGAALVEFALIVPILFLIVMGVVDIGDAWFRSASATAASRAAAIAAFDSGELRDHDLRTLQAIVTEANNRGIENIQKVVIWDAGSHPTEPPESCLQDSAISNGGIPGLCTAYGAAFLDSVRDGSATSEFGPCTDASVADAKWCTDDRPNGNPTWDVGIYFEAEEEYMTGALPMLQTFTISQSVIVRESIREPVAL